MSLSLETGSQIHYRDITGLSKIGTKNNVWLLKGKRREVVIKADQLRGCDPIGRARFANQTMTAIDKNLETNALNAREVKCLRHFARHILHEQGCARRNQGVTFHQDQRDACRRFLEMSKDPSFTFFKMKKLEVTDLESAATQGDYGRINPNETDLEHFAEALTRRGGWEMIGKIAIVDLLNKNDDRFSPEGDGPSFCGYRPKALIRACNVFIQKDADGSFRVCGLDFIPGSPAFDAGPGVDPSLVKNVAAEPLVYLNDPRRRKAYAKNIADDLTHLISLLRPNIERNSISLDSSQAANRIETGMLEAAKVIIRKETERLNNLQLNVRAT